MGRRAQGGAACGTAPSVASRGVRAMGVGLLITGCALAGIVWALPALARGAEPCVVQVEVEGIVGPATHDYLAEAVEEAQDRGCAAMLVRLDTPGGMLDPTRDIVKLFLGAPVPVITYVAPEGARAGSAGMFITLAAHVAAMAPGSNIGAAHPVTSGATEVDPETMRKITNDTAALARAIASRRGRNVEWAEKAVRDSVSATAEEAASLGVVDVIAPSRSALLRQLDGTVRQVAGEAQRLVVRDARIVEAEMTIQQRAQATLSHPTVISVLLMLGALGLVLELSTPGVGIAAGVGLLAFLLAAVGLNAIPVNYAGVALILVAAGLFVAEVFVTSFGLLAVAGFAFLLLGAALLMDRTDPNFFADASVSISWSVIIPTALLVALGVAAMAYRAGRLRKRPFWLGDTDLVGSEGLALTDVDARGGQVRVQGEIWQARSDTVIASGTPVRVQGREGLRLQVSLA